MAALIQSLIGTDNAELIRDEIAAILLLESQGQMALAEAATPWRDPEEFKIRVYTERSNPWDEWTHPGDDVATGCDKSPIVNVSLARSEYDKSRSDAVQRQMNQATYNVDCFGYGVTQQQPGQGHVPGDLAACLAAQRCARLVRNILMAAQYAYLGHQGLVWGRWINSITYMEPSKSDRPIDHVMGARVELLVEMNEFSPQYVGQPLELISTQLTKTSDGQFVLGAVTQDFTQA